METCLEKKEAIPEEVEAVVEHQEVRNEDFMVEMIGATENQTRDRAIPA
jgi:hypothetical protein